jgi:hypothetical protein
VAGSSILPLYAIDLGPDLPRETPVVAYFGGVHGLESIGSKILLAHLSSLRAALSWDSALSDLLRRVRVVFVPIVNPSGVLFRRRSNANGVDLMRNSPVESREIASSFHLFRGHRLSPRLPWYRGADHAPMEPEVRAVTDFVRRVVFPSPFALALDVHSGFFGRDRLWFPYAHTRRLFPNAAELLALKDVLDDTYPNHRYVIQPQSTQYTTHGDLWDYLYDRQRAENPAGIFLPLTLELGASSWFKKNPSQLLFDRRGLFHPVKEHRVQRLLRRHAHLLEFVMRLGASYERWIPRDATHRTQLTARAHAMWD